MAYHFKLHELFWYIRAITFVPFSVAGHVGPWSYFGLGLHNPEQLRLMGSSSLFLSDTHRIHGAAIYGNIYHKYTPNVRICTIHGSYGICSCFVFFSRVSNFASTSYALLPHGNPADVCVCSRYSSTHVKSFQPGTKWEQSLELPLIFWLGSRFKPYRY